MNVKMLFNLFRESVFAFNRDRGARLGAALAFYTISSIAPLIVVAAGIAGLLLKETNLQQHIAQTVASSLGSVAADDLSSWIDRAASPKTGSSLAATIIGAILTLFSASGIFLQVRDAINTLWNLHPEPSNSIAWWKIVWERIVSILCVFIFGLILIGFLSARVAIIAFEDRLNISEPYVTALSSNTLAVLLFTLIFALIFRYLPNIRLPWKEIWIGAFVTAVLFGLGQYIIGEYLGRATLTSVYGAAGSLVALLTWMYYSSQILLFGAEITWIYANTHGAYATQDKNTSLNKGIS
ncbi:MAG: YihY/virulence factor BrkB family protein [Deinococcaceae bacterium]